MNSDEEAELDDARVSLRELLAGRKVPQDQIDDAIYHYDFDLDKAAAYLISRLDKEQLKAKAKALKQKDHDKRKFLQMSSVAPSSDQHLPENEQPPKMSKLQMLAASRKSKSQAPTVDASAQSQPSSKPKSSLASLSAKYTSGSASSILDRLKSKTNSPSDPGAASPSLGKFSLKSARAKELAAVKTDTNNGENLTPPVAGLGHSVKQKRIKAFPEFSSDISLDFMAVDPRSFSPVVTVLCNHTLQPTTTKSQLTKVASSVFNADKAKSAFDKPSPDDVVLAAQAAGFTKKEQPPSKEKDEPKQASKIDMTSRMAELSLEQVKNSTAFVVIGHVDAGKSTLMGRLLLDSGNVDQHLIDKYTKQSTDMGKSSFALAWVMDQTEEERTRGVTIDICVSSFDTPSTHFTIVDAPGHRDFVPNMIAGSSQADTAVLVVDSSTNAFESGFSLDGQTKEHAILVRSLGVDSMVVAVNKMDTLDWDQARFNDIVCQLREFLTKVVGFTASSLAFVPVSGLNGDNVVRKSANPRAHWYTGEPVLGVLETWTASRAAATLSHTADSQFLMFVSDCYTASHSSNTLVSGRVESGAVRVGDVVQVSPSGVSSVVKAVESSSSSSSSGPRTDSTKGQFALAGQLATLNLGPVPLDQVAVGDTVSHDGVPSCQLVTARIVVFDLKRPLLNGTKLVFHRGRTNVPCKIAKLVSTVDKATGAVLKNKPRHLSSGQTAVVQVQLDVPLPLRTFHDVKPLGRFVLRKDGSTVAAGIVDAL